MKAAVARLALFSLLLSVMAVHWTGRLVWRLIGKVDNGKKEQGRSARNVRPNRIVMIGTFYNPGWFYAHVGPLIQCDQIDEVLVICDEPVNLGMQGVSFHCPTPRLTASVGRGLARVVTLLRVGWKLRPRIYMGYHIIPNAPLALMAAGLFGGRAIYQMTGGPIQIIQGGYQSENPLLRATGSPSRLQEKLVFALVRRFDAVVVRGSKARDFVLGHRLARSCFVITGAIDTQRFQPGDGPKDIDVVYVGRLVENKGVEEYLAVLESLRAVKPNLKASIVGDGPLRARLEQAVAGAGMRANVSFHGKLEDVTRVLTRSRIFVLLSPSEGMSIAMLEAMAAGLPVVVTDVGDLSDALEERGGGVLIDCVEPDKVAAEIAEMLDEAGLWERRSRAARDTIVAQFSVRAISDKWRRELERLLA